MGHWSSRPLPNVVLAAHSSNGVSRNTVAAKRPPKGGRKPTVNGRATVPSKRPGTPATTPPAGAKGGLGKLLSPQNLQDTLKNMGSLRGTVKHWLKYLQQADQVLDTVFVTTNSLKDSGVLEKLVKGRGKNLTTEDLTNILAALMNSPAGSQLLQSIGGGEKDVRPSTTPSGSTATGTNPNNVQRTNAPAHGTPAAVGNGSPTNGQAPATAPYGAVPPYAQPGPSQGPYPVQSPYQGQGPYQGQSPYPGQGPYPTQGPYTSPPGPYQGQGYGAAGAYYPPPGAYPPTGSYANPNPYGGPVPYGGPPAPGGYPTPSPSPQSPGSGTQPMQSANTTGGVPGVGTAAVEMSPRRTAIKRPPAPARRPSRVQSLPGGARVKRRSG